MASEHWFRWHHGCVTDPKFRVIASRCVTGVTVGHVIAVWAAMMENASQASPRGSLSGWDDEDVAAGLGFEVVQVSSIREAMQGKVLDGDSLNAWEKRQPKREDSSAERTRKWRESKASGVPEKERIVTRGDEGGRSETPETETETEEKRERKAIPRVAARFDEFWQAYPEKKGRADAERSWRRHGLDALADTIIADVAARKVGDRQWLEGYVPHGSTYVNKRGWEDAITPPRPGKSPEPAPRVRPDL